jgi:hypothetical protein
MMFGCVLKHLANLRYVKRNKTCVSSLSARLGTEVVKCPFYSMGPKMTFGCVSEHFADLRHVKVAKLVLKPECTILRYENCQASILVDWIKNDVWECFIAFR